MDLLSNARCFGGEQRRYQHASGVNHCEMTFSVYLPPEASANKPVPYLLWLSGLTCSDENFVQKAGAQQYAANHNIAIVCPDTSPRGEGVADDPEAAYDFGLAAGFYVDATQAPWQQHYNMYSYITEELPTVLDAEIPELSNRCSISGHSMGGHGALTIALKHPTRYRSVSAFAPICAPLQCPWGEKALSNYLGDDKTAWQAYDSCVLIQQSEHAFPILVEQGSADKFLDEQLKPKLLEQAAKTAKFPLTVRYQPDYDHSYFFIASFIEEHIKYHSNALYT